jgi:peptidoglycan hydrolase CwlO-like protein
LAGPKRCASCFAFEEKKQSRQANACQRKSTSEMEQVERKFNRKGGRPKKAVKRDQQITVACSLIEKNVIEQKAKYSNLTNSEYLRQMGLTGKIDSRLKVLPKEVLQLTAALNHMGANLNQVAKKRNSLDELNAIERAELNQLSRRVKELAGEIKKHLQLLLSD